MDFARVLEAVASFLDARGARLAIAGAFALHAYGNTRATSDLDLIVEAWAQADLLTFVEQLGYETLYLSIGFSNHLHQQPALGRLDFIYIDDHTARLLFGGAHLMPLFPGRQVLVPRPEHLAAMKVLAMKNDPSRTFHELSDIQFLLGLPGVDTGEIRATFEQHGLAERFNELERTIKGS